MCVPGVSGVVRFDEVVGMALTAQTRMLGDQLLCGKDQHLLRLFVHRHLFPHESFRNRVAIRVQVDVTLGVDHPVMNLGHHRNMGWQWQEVWFLDEEGGLGTPPQDPLRLGVGDRLAPAADLGVEIGPVPETTPGKKVILHIGEGALDAPLTIGMADGMRDKLNAEQFAESLLSGFVAK